MPSRAPISRLVIAGTFILLLALTAVYCLKKENTSHDQDTAKTPSTHASDHPVTSETKATTATKHSDCAICAANSSTASHSRRKQATPTAASTHAQQLAATDKYLRKILTRNESAITTEILPDGTELIHMNGSFAHVSAATIDEAGQTHVNCHDSYEGLTGAIQQTTPKQLTR